jgi:hypothetical protein
MKMRTKVVFVSGLPFLSFFAFGVTEAGQKVLIGKIPPNIDHWKADDIYMEQAWLRGFMAWPPSFCSPYAGYCLGC